MAGLSGGSVQITDTARKNSARLESAGLHTRADYLLAEVHANKKANDWIKHLGQLVANSPHRHRAEISASLERIDAQVKADPTIMLTMDPSLRDTLTRQIVTLARVVDPRSGKSHLGAGAMIAPTK